MLVVVMLHCSPRIIIVMDIIHAQRHPASGEGKVESSAEYGDIMSVTIPYNTCIHAGVPMCAGEVIKVPSFDSPAEIPIPSAFFLPQTRPSLLLPRIFLLPDGPT